MSLMRENSQCVLGSIKIDVDRMKNRIDRIDWNRCSYGHNPPDAMVDYKAVISKV